VQDGRRIQIAAYLMSGLWSLVLLGAGIHIGGAWVKVVSALPLVVVVAFAVFDNWAWQIRAVRKVTGRPQLNGTWRGELTSLRNDAEGREVPHEPMPIYLAIRQTFLNIRISLLSVESKSRSIGPILERHGAHDYTIYYHYTNLPGLEARERSPTHAGGARVEVGGIDPSRLNGEYWTDRRTRGTFSVERVSRSTYWIWSEAESALTDANGGS
jgi:SMODS-associating 2TM, beta-strand rich effector domain